MPALTLKSAQFRREREAGWAELELLLERAGRRGVGLLTPADLERLPLLYRAALSSLSVARAIALDRHLLLYLEDLALRSYLVVYAPQGSLMEALGGFFRDGLPRAMRQVGPHVAIAVVALVAGVVLGFVLTVNDEEWASALMPGWLGGGRGPLSTREDLLDDEINAPWPGLVESFVTFAGFLFRNNTMVGVLAFGLGALAGVPTLMLTAFQGVTLGALLALHVNRGLGFEFIAWVSIHGVTELGAVVLCAAGGLLVAEKILFPGQYSRLDSLARSGPVAAHVAMGAMLLFLLAAIIEGGFRQLVQDPWARLAIGFGVGAVWVWVFTRRVAAAAP